MTAFEQSIHQLTLPRLILVHNLKFYSLYDQDAPIASGELLGHSEEYARLQKKIPPPPFPSSESGRQLVYEFLDVENQAEFEQKAAYNDTVYGLTGDFTPSDSELFGETYTILLLCPPDIPAIVSFLVGRIKALAGEEQISFAHLQLVWEQYVDRIHIYPFNAIQRMLIINTLYEDIISEFIEKVQMLPNAPEEEDWEELDEWLSM